MDTTKDTPPVDPPDPRIQALAKHTGEDPDEIAEASYGENLFEIGREEYLVLTDDEADEACTESIKESLYAFKPSFLVYYLVDGMTEKALQAIQELCEDANEPLQALIVDMGHLVNDAVSSDGRGHFLAHYDSEENEETIDGVTYYIYRVN